MSLKLGDELNPFLEALKSESLTSIRINPEKVTDFEGGINTPHCTYGYYLDTRPSFSEDPRFHAGAYYVQEASSMILAYVLEEIQKDIPNEQPLKILDLCAAPGGKTTIISDFVPFDSLIVANEVIKARSNILKENVIKWGRSNIVVTNNDPSQFKGFEQYFDIIVIDAPCSGEGMFRKDPNAIKEWSEDNVKICGARQQRIIHDIHNTLRPGGKIIYSTCTYNDIENINVVNEMIQQYDLSSRSVVFPSSFGITEVKNEQSIGYHLYPHKVKGEGLFISILEKQNENTEEQPTSHYKNLKKILLPLDKSQLTTLKSWIKADQLNSCLIHPNGDVYHYNELLGSEINFILQNLKVVYSGIKCGNLNKSLFIPDHALALSDIVYDDIPRKELNIEDAQNYLRRKLDFVVSDSTGWHLATYKKLPLGWFKNLGNRINNYYPMEYRLRK